MSVFVDTSAFYAFRIGTELDHAAVKGAFTQSAEGGRRMLTTNYVVVETVALLQHRIGFAPVRDLESRVLTWRFERCDDFWQPLANCAPGFLIGSKSEHLLAGA